MHRSSVLATRVAREDTAEALTVAGALPLRRHDGPLLQSLLEDILLRTGTRTDAETLSSCYVSLLCLAATP